MNQLILISCILVSPKLADSDLSPKNDLFKTAADALNVNNSVTENPATDAESVKINIFLLTRHICFDGQKGIKELLSDYSIKGQRAVVFSVFLK